MLRILRVIPPPPPPPPLRQREQEKNPSKYLLLIIIILALPLKGYAQAQEFSLGNFSFGLSPKILKEGSIIDVDLGLRYTNNWGGLLRFRNTAVSENEEFEGLADSLNAKEDHIFEVCFLPITRYFNPVPALKVWIGGGGYYEYEKRREKGFFNMPELETLDPPQEPVNAYTNDFTMHLVGPLLELGISYTLHWFDIPWFGQTESLGLGIALSGGVVPVFGLSASSKMGMVPLTAPAAYNQQTWGSPYWYLSLDSVILRFINLTLSYEYARLQFESIDFDNNLQPIHPEQTLITQSFRIETSLLLPVGGGIQAQIGYGYTFDSTKQEGGATVTGNRHYLILTVKKTGL